MDHGLGLPSPINTIKVKYGCIIILVNNNRYNCYLAKHRGTDLCSAITSLVITVIYEASQL